MFFDAVKQVLAHMRADGVFDGTRDAPQAKRDDLGHAQPPARHPWGIQQAHKLSEPRACACAWQLLPSMVFGHRDGGQLDSNHIRHGTSQ